MTDEDILNALLRLRAILGNSPVAWLAEVADRQIAEGKEVSVRVATLKETAPEEPTRRRERPQYEERGKAELVKVEELSLQEQLEVWLDVLESTLVETPAMEQAIRQVFDAVPVEDGDARPQRLAIGYDTEGEVGTLLEVPTEDRATAVTRLRDLLQQVRRELAG